jgi:8-oxo-dGTP pyrophosphatase MutT (NUDIX family)
MKKTETAGGVVLNKAGQVLVVSQHGTSWSLPKGHIEKGENQRQAAEREIYEETGVNHLVFKKELGSYERYRIGLKDKDDKSELKKIHMFLFETEQNDLKPIDPHNPEAKWVSKEKVEELLTHPKDKAFYKSIMSKF